MLLTEFQGHATATVDAQPAEVFDTITTIERLPEWNARIARVVRAPHAALAVGVEWTVKMSVMGAKWDSRSRVVVYDPERMYFEHMTQTDDGNPSFVVWRWSVTPWAEGARVTVDWVVYPKTFWRRLLFGRIRRRQLPGEVAASLDALAYHLALSPAAT
jgi:hypothetical protein